MTFSKMKERFSQLRTNSDGFAITEFAFVAPVMLMLVMSGLELAHYALTHMRVSEIANTVSDNAGRVQGGMDEANAYEIFSGAEAIGKGISFKDNGRVVLSSLQSNGRTGNSAGQKIEWQRCFGKKTSFAPKYGTEGKGKNDASLKDGMGAASNRIASANGNAVMFAEVSYNYTPLFFDGFIDATVIRYETAFTVRDSTNVTIKNGQGLTKMTC